MILPIWARVLLWLEVPLVLLLNVWYTPYAILVAWGLPLLLERWGRHMALLEELVYLTSKRDDALVDR